MFHRTTTVNSYSASSVWLVYNYKQNTTANFLNLLIYKNVSTAFWTLHTYSTLIQPSQLSTGNPLKLLLLVKGWPSSRSILDVKFFVLTYGQSFFTCIIKIYGRNSCIHRWPVLKTESLDDLVSFGYLSCENKNLFHE